MPEDFKVIGFDPGETTGWAVLDNNGKMLTGGNVKSIEWEGIGKKKKASISADLLDLLDTLKANEYEMVVIEEYRVQQGKQMMHTGKPVVTEQIVGILKAWAIRGRSRIMLYRNTDKKIQQMHSQQKPHGAHSGSHYVDAYNHAWWWLFQNKYVSSKLQQMKGVTNARKTS